MRIKQATVVNGEIMDVLYPLSLNLVGLMLQEVNAVEKYTQSTCKVFFRVVDFGFDVHRVICAHNIITDESSSIDRFDVSFNVPLDITIDDMCIYSVLWSAYVMSAYDTSKNISDVDIRFDLFSKTVEEFSHVDVTEAI